MLTIASTQDFSLLCGIPYNTDKADVEKHIEKAVQNALETAPVSLNDFFADFDKQQKNQDLSPTAKTPEEIKTEAKAKEENQFLSPEDLERNLENVMSKAQIISEWNNYFAKKTIEVPVRIILLKSTTLKSGMN